jgi:3D (Asp-Asp-Asp) domain-containing protein
MPVHVTPLTPYEYAEARITCYAPTGYNMANTKPPKNGWVATSDRTIPFNTKIEVRGKEYLVGDRTAKFIHEKHGLTIDIFMEKGCDAKFGAKREMVKIYK